MINPGVVAAIRVVGVRGDPCGTLHHKGHHVDVDWTAFLLCFLKSPVLNWTIISAILVQFLLSYYFTHYSYNNSQRDALFNKFILVKNSTCFGQSSLPK